MNTNVQVRGNEIVMTRVFDAPKKLVFETFSDCKHLNNWWGPRSWPLVYCNMDFREGGTWHFCMKGPHVGDESWGKVTYKEIKAPDRIVYDDYFSDKEGNINQLLPAAEIAFDFAEGSGKTMITSRAKYPTDEDLKKVLDMGMVDGMNETLDRLEELLARMLTPSS